VAEHSSWEFEEGDEIAPGLHAVSLLGGGRRYEAYLTWSDELLTLVTVKVLRPALVGKPGPLRGLAGEVRMLEATDHPRIVRSFGAELDGPRPHVVLEYLDGPRLSSLIRRHGVVVEQLLPLALEVCSALHYLAARRIVHLDVKPRNIIMAESPRLIDLSLAMPLDEVGRISKPIGTDAYMAPEQCIPERFAAIGPPADVWGLGVTLYEALARRIPFPPPTENRDDPPAERYPQIEHEPFELPSSVPPPLAELVLSCLAKNPEDRPRAAELHETLEPWTARVPKARVGLFRPGGRLRPSVFKLG
jgi:eukaryotic-like serine/threonine-protein kinase